MGRGRTEDEGRPVEPGEARTAGHDPAPIIGGVLAAFLYEKTLAQH
jgi:hypothetical protein